MHELRRRPKSFGPGAFALGSAPLSAALLSGLLGLLAWTSRAPESAQAASLAQVPDNPCPQDRLYNGGFEGGFDDRGRPEIQVGLGWQPWAQGSDLSDPAGSLRYLPLNRRRSAAADAVRQGWWAQGLEGLPPGATAGLWQRVRLPLGAKVLVYAWGGVGSEEGGAAASADAAAEDGKPGEGPDAAQAAGAWRLRLGWDPQGGSDPGQPRLSWTAPLTLTTGWAPFALPPFEAEGTVGTLFLEGLRLPPGLVAPAADPAAIPGRAASLLRRADDAAAGGQLRWDGACVGLLDAPPLPTVPSPVPLVTLDPRSPEPPPLETLAIVLAGQAQATAAAQALELRATQRAAGGAGRLIAGGAAPFMAAEQHGPVPDAPPPAEPGLAARLYDASGLLLLLLAAALAGLMAARRGPTRPPPSS